ncbi:phosphoglucomutase, alpha-D-glucose phosphate-specific [Canibacter sp. lx-45]|uniref:phosphoglucomutase, alpha-D-glucose phosphate-specific n=1 Tax=Canibacter zhuwentaonis TaxID=2837491 RepID=UPI001BDD252E|nr:phosphoglucomutase, alpha-D-glucose phosphate-specific [Canibacter zhuwentaonis]MBT1035854.1 phosphoglucomutase, alpha-D-glucose phosphate-specific [Canibacter zhuwentaonis]
MSQNKTADAPLLDLAQLRHAYYAITPDPEDASQRVAFGTAGHRGTAFNGSFNEAHTLAVCAAIAQYRADCGITGPLFLGADPHPLSEYALPGALEMFTRLGVAVRGAAPGEYVPTPVLSRAIIKHNRGLVGGAAENAANLADGVLLTPSHNPPQDGGIKYNLPHGGPAGTAETAEIERLANEFLREISAAGGAQEWLAKPEQNRVSRGTVVAYDFLGDYVQDLAQVVDMRAIKDSKLRFAAHPLGGAAEAYWVAIKKAYDLDLTLLGSGIDKTWSFMSLDWDGKIRMDPSSPMAMRTVTEAGLDYPLILANDADADRHGIVTADAGLLSPNHFLAVCIDYLLTHREAWQRPATIGKTIVSSAIIDKIVVAHEATLYEVPVGFKWFADGLAARQIVFAGEESAGATLLARDGEVWSTDKDGIALCLLAAEIYAVTGLSPSQYYAELVARYGESAYGRVDMPVTATQKAVLRNLSAANIGARELAGDAIVEVLTAAPGNGVGIGGVVIRTEHAWAAIRPSGTEAVMKVYAESFLGDEHLRRVQEAAAQIAQNAAAGAA